MSKSIQIIGQVTGLELEYAQVKFNHTQMQLELKGYLVFNPMKMVDPETAWNAAMRICLSQLLQVDEVAIQPDWNLSRGAGIEVMIASALGLKMMWL